MMCRRISARFLQKCKSAVMIKVARKATGKFRVRAFEAERYVTHLCQRAADDSLNGYVIKASGEGNIAALL
jgi:hypothetical protein